MELQFMLFLVKNGILDTFLHNCTDPNGFMKNTHIHKYVSTAFNWASSKQGWGYWQSVSYNWDNYVLQHTKKLYIKRMIIKKRTLRDSTYVYYDQKII